MYITPTPDHPHRSEETSIPAQFASLNSDNVSVIGSAIESQRRDYSLMAATCQEQGDSHAVDHDRLRESLVRDGDWTPAGAEHLLKLVTENGAFVLRNALALALALDIEDGSLGL